jgi:hypothetical protein
MYNGSGTPLAKPGITRLFLVIYLPRSMRTVQSTNEFRPADAGARKGASLGLIASCCVAAMLAVFAFYLSLIATSAPLELNERLAVQRAIGVLEEKGFEREAFFLRHTVAFRSTDNWLNYLTEHDKAYAATNFPFQIITLYPDFFFKTTDDTERAVVLLHEAQHLQRADEKAAYSYVWNHRAQLGWTQLSHGTTPSYVTIAEQTREFAPDLFRCPDKVFDDCTETLAVKRQKVISAQ